MTTPLRMIKRLPIILALVGLILGTQSAGNALADSEPGWPPYRPKLVVEATPDTVFTQRGTTHELTVTLWGHAPRAVSGTLKLETPAGWEATPRQQAFVLRSDGLPVYETYQISFTIPDNADLTTHDLVVVATSDDFGDDSGARASTTTSVSVNPPPRFGFEGGTDGWEAGANVSSVARVTDFLNGPGHPLEGEGALDATCAEAPASSWHTAAVRLPAPVDLGAAETVTAYVNGYGSNSLNSYEARVTLTSATGEDRTTTIPIAANEWNEVAVDVTDWPGRTGLESIEVGFRGLGGDFNWQCHFQVDSVLFR